MFLKYLRLICLFSCIISFFSCKSVSSDTSGIGGPSYTISLADFIYATPDQIFYNDSGTIFLKNPAFTGLNDLITKYGFTKEQISGGYCLNQELYSVGSNQKKLINLKGSSEYYAIQPDIMKAYSSSWRTPRSLNDIKIQDYFMIIHCSDNYGIYLTRNELAKIKISDLLSSDCNDKRFIQSNIIPYSGEANYGTLVFTSRNPNCLNTNADRYNFSNFYAGYDENTTDSGAISMSGPEPTGCEGLSVDSTGAKNGYYYYSVSFEYSDSIRDNIKLDNIEVLNEPYFKIFKPVVFSYFPKTRQISVKIYKCSNQRPATLGSYLLRH